MTIRPEVITLDQQSALPYTNIVTPICHPTCSSCVRIQKPFGDRNLSYMEIIMLDLHCQMQPLIARAAWASFRNMYWCKSQYGYVITSIMKSGWNTYPFPNLSGKTIEVWEWITNLIHCFGCTFCHSLFGVHILSNSHALNTGVQWELQNMTFDAIELRFKWV